MNEIASWNRILSVGKTCFLTPNERDWSVSFEGQELSIRALPPLSPAVGLLVPLLLHMLSMLLTHDLPRIRAIHPSVCIGVLRLCLCRGGLKVSSAFHIYPGICYAYFEGYSETAMIGLPNAGIPAWLEGSRRLTGALPTHVYAPSYATHINFGFCFFPS